MILADIPVPENPFWFFLALTLIGLYILACLSSIFRSILRIFIEYVRKGKVRQKDFSLIGKYLTNLKYYNNLSEHSKERFVRRLKRILSEKEFFGTDEMEVTSEMRILISAAFVQITFGLKYFSLPHFHSIKIFPGEFYSRLMDKHLKGGTSQSGFIMLSWKDFLKGNIIENDKVNLGFHEIAHALLIDMLHGKERNLYLEEKIGQWEEVSEPEMAKIKEGKSVYLRAYGGNNEHEFFAVSVEHFFEDPEGLKRSLPEIYKRLCILLNQDPQNSSGDYELRHTVNYS